MFKKIPQKNVRNLKTFRQVLSWNKITGAESNNADIPQSFVSKFTASIKSPKQIVQKIASDFLNIHTLNITTVLYKNNPALNKELKRILNQSTGNITTKKTKV